MNVIAKRRTADNVLVQFWEDGAISTHLNAIVIAKGLPRDLLWLIAEDASLYDVTELRTLVKAARKAWSKRVAHNQFGAHGLDETRRLMRVFTMAFLWKEVA